MDKSATIMTEEAKRKSEFAKKEGFGKWNKGKIPWNKGKKGIQIGVWKNKKRPPFSDEWKRNMGRALKGRIASEETKERLRLAKLGKRRRPMPLEQRRKISLATRGDKAHAWKGGVATVHKMLRKSFEYKLWRTAVFERDNYKCVLCGNTTSGNLEADHIKPFALFPELRFAIDNGRTLCKQCHRRTETYGEGTKRYLQQK